jgi:hypothetical protein
MSVSEVLDSLLGQLKGIEMTILLLKARIDYESMGNRLSNRSKEEQMEYLKRYMESRAKNPPPRIPRKP